MTNRLPNFGQTTRLYNNQQKQKRTCRIVLFAVLTDHRVKMKECTKKNKYFDLTEELKQNVEHENDDYTNYNWCS